VALSDVAIDTSSSTGEAASSLLLLFPFPFSRKVFERTGAGGGGYDPVVPFESRVEPSGSIKGS